MKINSYSGIRILQKLTLGELAQKGGFADCAVADDDDSELVEEFRTQRFVVAIGGHFVLCPATDNGET